MSNQPVSNQPGQGYGQSLPMQGYAPPAGAQAQGQAWMPKPAIAGCPPGLEYLTQINQLLVHQQVELLEVFTGWEAKNKYQVKNSVGQQVYFACEESDACARQCCGPARGFLMHITDNMNQEVIRIDREFKCCAGCGWCADNDCCAMELNIQAPPGNIVGYVKQAKSCWTPKYNIYDAQMNAVMTVSGPCCPVQGPCCQADVEFPIFGSDGSTQVGKISKQWSGWREVFTDADHFGVEFPMDLDVNMKATMLGALFLIDFMYFEKQQN